MAKYDKDHKPTGDAAKAAKLEKDFQITGAIRSGGTVYKAGDEEAYAETKPSVADVSRLSRSGALTGAEKGDGSKGE